MKFTRYFEEMRLRSDRADIKLEWIERAINQPIKEVIQADGRIRRWVQIPEMAELYSCQMLRRYTMRFSIGLSSHED